MLIVVWDLSVGAILPCVILDKSLVKKFMVQFTQVAFNIGQYRTKIVRVLRSQIFRQIVQRGRGKAVALQGRIVQYDGKDASKTCTKSNKWSLCGVAIGYVVRRSRFIHVVREEIPVVMFNAAVV